MLNVTQDIENQNILVTEGAGFIGSHLVCNLISKNQVSNADLFANFLIVHSLLTLSTTVN